MNAFNNDFATSDTEALLFSVRRCMSDSTSYNLPARTSVSTIANYVPIECSGPFSLWRSITASITAIPLVNIYMLYKVPKPINIAAIWELMTWIEVFEIYFFCFLIATCFPQGIHTKNANTTLGCGFYNHRFITQHAGAPKKKQ